MVTLTIKDETLTGDVLNSVDLSFLSEIVTVKDIISQRVQAEVSAYNEQRETVFKGFVQPTVAEILLNGSFKVKKHTPIDAEKQVYVALDAFQNNAFFVLIDDEQAESLEQAVVIKKDMVVSFVKLTPLVGG